MNRTTRSIIAGIATVAAVGAGAGVAAGAVGGTEPGDIPITGDALDRAKAAALEYTGGGHVTATEVGDEESYYEVEVALPDGYQTDVQLDESFDVVTSETESDDSD